MFVIVGISKISEKGQITIPKEVRERLNLLPGDKVCFEIKEGKIIYKKKKEPI